MSYLSRSAKDLLRLSNIDLRKLVHVGNAPHEFFQPDNGYLVSSYYHDVAAYRNNDFNDLEHWLRGILPLVRDAWNHRPCRSADPCLIVRL